MAAFFTADPGKPHMKITTVEISVNYGHDVCSPIAILFGQIYLAVLIARLVGMQAVPPSKDQSAGL